MRELRVHGVGGPQEERLLGVLGPDDLAVSTIGDGTRIVRRRDGDPDVEGYSWGALTSSSLNAASWVLYLPFSLINGAGWATPITQRGWVGRVHSTLVHMLAVTATLSYVTWIGYLLLDLVGFQWRNRLMKLRDITQHGWLSGAVEYAMPLACAAIFILLIVGLFVSMNRRSPTDRLEADEDAGGWKPKETFSPAFYQHRKRERILWLLHIVVAFAGIAAVITVAALRHDNHDQLWLGELIVGVGLAQGFVVALLWLTTLVGRTRPIAAAIATLGAVAANATFAGLAILAVKSLSGFPDGHDLPTVKGGPELGLTSIFLWSLVAGVVVMVIAGIHYVMKSIDDTDLPPVVDGGINHPVDGLTPDVRAKVLHARRLARLAHSAPMPVCLLALAFVGGGVAYVIACAVDDRWPFDHLHGYVSTAWPDWIGGLVLTALPLAVALAFRRAATSTKDRRVLGMIWDVLLIWPRRYHPLAVPPYAADATTELRHRMLHHLEGKGKLLVSAHSQGSALSFIALTAIAASPDALKLKRAWYLTYGSHLNGLYGLIYPAHFDNYAIMKLQGELAEWRNFWRRTDPIGGPIILTNNRPYLGELVPGDDRLPDEICADPPAGPVGGTELASRFAPRERDRPSWTELTIHSHYLAEPQVKKWVADLKGS